MKRRIAALVVALAAIIAGVGFASPAHAVSNNLIVNVRYGECLEALGGGALGSGVGHFLCDEFDQRWSLDSAGTVIVVGARLSAFRIRSLSTGLCMDIQGNGTASGTLVVQQPCTVGVVQQTWWFLFEPGGGSFYIGNLYVFQRTGALRVIDVPPHTQSSLVRIWTLNRTSAQQFFVI